jgi:hypothetical protein
MTRPLRPDATARPVGAFKLADTRDSQTAPPLEPLLGIDDLAATLNCSRRLVERMRSAGRLPCPDLRLGRLPRWRVRTIRDWIDEQARNGRGGRT